MKILKTKKNLFFQKLKKINKYNNDDLKEYKKNKLINYSEKITNKIPKILILKIEKKINFKIQDLLQTSDYLLDHLYFINKDIIKLKKKKNEINLNLDNALISIELLNISKLMFSWIENSKMNSLLSDSKIIQIMDVLLSISTHFSYEVGDSEFNLIYSKACQDASEFLFNLHCEEGENIILDHFWQIKKLLLFFYESNYFLKENDREIICDIADKITVIMLKKKLDWKLNLKNIIFNRDFKYGVNQSIKSNKIFVKNSQLDLESEIKKLSFKLIK